VKLNSFKDLKVWQLSHKLSIEVAKLVKNFPKDEKYDLGDQMRRVHRSLDVGGSIFHWDSINQIDQIKR